MKSWKNIEEMFDALHETACEYIILRNYEEIDEDNFYTSGHADIDFLAVDSQKFAKIIQGYPRFIVDDRIHYIVKIEDTEVIVDVRSIGDGYYDTNWEKDMLSKRKLFDGRFYIADDVNYYYSLIYHAILQKKQLANDYLRRLNGMANALGIKASSEKEHLLNLEIYMKEHNYFFTYPFDIHVPFRKELVNNKMVKKYMNVYLRDIKIKLLQIGSKVKNKIIRS